MADDPMYHEGMRRLQDARETRPLADRLEQVIVRRTFTDDDREFIGRCPMFFIATADAHGRPDCSYKGGLPGFVRVLDDRTLAIPDFDGNGMYRTWGNVLVNPNVGLMFLDFENPKRLRVNGTARVSEDDPLRDEYPGSVFIIRVTANRIFPNCPRYVHRMQLVEQSVYVPGPEHTPPVPAWKTSDAFRDSLPARDRQDGALSVTSGPGEDGVFSTTRLFPFTPAQVYAAFADADRLASWWGPDDFRNSFEVFEFKPRGRWTFVMHGPDGKDYPNESIFLETSQERIVVRHISPPGFTLTITLAEADGRTTVHWRQAFDDPRVAASLAHIVVPANEQNLNRLHRVLLAGGE